MEFLEFKNFIDEDIVESEFERIMDSPWNCAGHSLIKEHDIKGENISLWMKKLDEDPFYYHHLFWKLQNITGRKYCVDRIYANGQFHGQCGSMHTDFPSEQTSARTLLIYLNKEWKPEWGGHTIIQDSVGNYHSILPEPGKAILFNGYMPHVGLEPTVHCKTMRITVAFKMFDSELYDLQ